MKDTKVHSIPLEGVWTLFNDESVQKKLIVMSRWDAMMDDGRNPESDMAERLDQILELGKSYKITLILEEVSDV